MALTDNLLLKIKAEAGQSNIKDSINNIELTDGTGTLTLVNDGTHGYLWRLQNGTKSATFATLGKYFDVTARTATVAFRLRVTNRASAYTKYAAVGVDAANNHLVINNAGSSTGQLRTQVVSGSAGGATMLTNYTTGDVVTVVVRYQETGTASDFGDLWRKAHGGSVVKETQLTTSISSTARETTYTGFTAGATETLDILNFAFWNRGLSDVEAEAVAGDIDGQVWGGSNAAPTFPGPNIGNQTGTVGTALTSNNIAAKFSDTDALTFSAIGTWPPGVTVSSAGVISGTPTTAGTYTGLSVRATDTAAQTVDSDTFSFTISATADTTAPTLTGSITISSLTTTSYTASWPAGSDNVAVTGYQYRIASGSWVDAGNVLTVNITGRTPGATESFEVRAYDAAANYSTPALSTSVTLNSAATGTITIPAVKDWETGNLKLNQGGVQVDIRNITTGALVVRKTGQTTHATTGVCVVTDASIVAGTTYEVVTRFADGSKGMWDYTAT